MDMREKKLRDEADFQDLKVQKNIRKQTDDFYGDEATAYMLEQKKNLIGKVQGKRILEVGCGKGEATLEMLQGGAFVTAIDISPKSIDFVIQSATVMGLEDRLEAMVMDAQHLQMANEGFDIVIGNGILHHLPDLDQTMSEVNRVLKPTGFAVFSEPLGMNPFLRIYRMLTPRLRTAEEEPFTMKELILIRQHFPVVQYIFFDCATLISKFFIAIGAKKFAHRIQKRLVAVDDRLLRRDGQNKLTFFQKMSWIVLMKLQKPKVKSDQR